jgi:hypothetical protein
MSNPKSEHNQPIADPVAHFNSTPWCSKLLSLRLTEAKEAGVNEAQSRWQLSPDATHPFIFSSDQIIPFCRLLSSLTKIILPEIAMAAPYDIPLLDQAAVNDFFAQFLSSLSNLNLYQQEAPKCTLCQSLTFETLLSGFQLHENFEELCTSSFSCPLCRIFQSALLNQPPENWWPDEEILSSDVLMAKLVRDARELNKFPERLEITVLRSEGEIKKQLEHNKYDKHPEIKLVKHCIVCVAPGEFPSPC